MLQIKCLLTDDIILANWHMQGLRLVIIMNYLTTKLAICYGAKRVTEIGKWYRCPIYGVLLHRRSLNHKMNSKLVQPVCTDITPLCECMRECMHRFRAGRPNLNPRATNTCISDQMRSPRMIFGPFGDQPFPALHGTNSTVQ